MTGSTDIIIHGTPEWHHARSQSVSGTDIGAILGINPYRSRLDVFVSKTIGGVGFSENENMRWGTLLEPVVAKEWARINEFEVTAGLFVQKGWMSGSPDFLIDNHKWGLEIKTAGYTQMKSYKEGKCPLNYEYQCRWYMMVMDYEKWYLAALVGGQKLFDFEFKRDMRIERMIHEEGKKFWDEVKEWRLNHQIMNPA